MKAFVFDMDGVILDTETISFKTWDIAAAEFGVCDVESAKFRCMGANRADTCQLLREMYGADFPSEKFIDRTNILFDEIWHTDGIALMPFAYETLEMLSKKYPLALATSTRRAKAVVQLKEVGVDHFFTTKTFGDDVAHSKPNPEIYLTACSSLDLSPEECFAVEDSPNGIKSAFSAGLKPIMIPDKFQPDEALKSMCYRIFKDLSELKNLL